MYFGGLLPVVWPEYLLKESLSLSVFFIEKLREKKSLPVNLTSAFEIENLEVVGEVSQPEVVFTLFKPLMY